MRFSNDHISAFKALSGDLNPLHLDAAYCRKTPFGRPVVYGMAAVLGALGKWAQGRPFRLKKLNADFQKPLFINKSYEYRETKNEQGLVTAKILSGTAVQAKLTWQAEWTEASDWTIKPAGKLSLRAHAADSPPVPFIREQPTAPLPETADHLHSINASWLPPLENLDFNSTQLGIQPGQMPLSQLGAILWLSYFVGMEFPGKQALFLGFSLEFDATADALPLHLDSLRGEIDPRFDICTLTGSGTGLHRLKAEAWLRPKPTHFSIDEIVKHAAPPSKHYQDQVALVTGASRGLGNVLAKTLAVHGATSLINYAQSEAEAQGSVDEIHGVQGKACAIAGDIADGSHCQQIKEKILSEYGHLDLLVLNASPNIPSLSWGEQSEDEILAFIEQSSRMMCAPLLRLLPLLRKGGTVLGISTLYTQKPQPGFAHYVAAKSMLEGLLRALASENQSLRFCVARPPKMSTDQTNTLFSNQGSMSPVPVAAKILKDVYEWKSEGNWLEIDFT